MVRRTNAQNADVRAPSAKTASAGGTQSLDRAIELLRVVAAHSGRGARLVDMVERSGLTKPTVHRLLQALERQGLVTQGDGDRLYHLGPEAFVLGTLASERYGLHRVALPSVLRLAGASEDTCFLSVRRDMHVVCLHREEGAFPIRSHVLRAGDRHPLGVGAGSLAILASLPDHEVAEAIAANGAELAIRYPEFSIDVLHREVIRTRENGYALNEGLLQAGSWGVGVAVLNRQGRCEGALSIAAIETRLAEPRRDQVAALLKAEAQRLSDRLASPMALRNDKTARASGATSSRSGARFTPRVSLTVSRGLGRNLTTREDPSPS